MARVGNVLKPRHQIRKKRRIAFTSSHPRRTFSRRSLVSFRVTFFFMRKTSFFCAPVRKNNETSIIIIAQTAANWEVFLCLFFSRQTCEKIVVERGTDTAVVQCRRLLYAMSFILSWFFRSVGLWNSLSDGLINAAGFGKIVKDFCKTLFRCFLLLLFVLFSEDTKQVLKKSKFVQKGKIVYMIMFRKKEQNVQCCFPQSDSTEQSFLIT